MPRPLPHHLHTRLSSDQWQLLEQTADAIDATLSGAIRHHLDLVLDEPVSDAPGAPTRRELMHDVTVDGHPVSIERVTRATSNA